MTSLSKLGLFENSSKKFIAVLQDKFHENLFLTYKITAQLETVKAFN